MDPEEAERQVKKRRELLLKRIELIKQAAKYGKRVNPKVFYDGDEVFGPEVKTQRDAERFLQVEHDITVALAFARWLQNHGVTTADINYSDVDW